MDDFKQKQSDIEVIYYRKKATASMETFGNKEVIYCRKKAIASMETFGNKEVIYCRKKAIASMETFGNKQLSVKEKKNLNSIFQEIVTTAGVDFSNPEIRDIQSAVTEMIERIKAGINERGLFSISRTELCGSMAEKTTLWKGYTLSSYIEFDFLAVLQGACDIEQDCPECFYVKTLPANLELLEQYYRTFYISYSEYKREIKHMLQEWFTRETNNCLASCGCLKVIYPYLNDWRRYTFERSSTSSETLQGCDKCTVDKPTGALRVKMSDELGGGICSLKFDWTSKAKTLCTRNAWCLPQTEKMDNLTIHIDFLPALEVFQSKQQSADVAACSSSSLVLNPTGSEYEHYCFVVPKRCVVCAEYGEKKTWRRSGCRAEIDTIVNKMSNKHRKCYQVLKHLTWLHNLNNYHQKIAVLHHNSLCSNTDEDCAKCAFKVLDDLQHAYKTRQLKSLHSQANLLEQEGIDSFNCRSYSNMIPELKEAMCSAVSESVSVSSFLTKVRRR